MTYAQRNPNPWPVALPEYRDEDGQVWPTTRVEAGAEVSWPIRIAGFDGFPEPQPVTAPVPATQEPEQTDAPADAGEAQPDAPAETAPAQKTTRSKSAAAAAGGKEA
jgi:hypothetical protein